MRRDVILWLFFFFRQMCSIVAKTVAHLWLNANQKLFTMKRNHQASKPPLSGNSSEVWLDKQDILQRMHISSRTLQQWRKKKILPYSRIGRKIWYREADLLELLEKAKVGGTKDRLIWINSGNVTGYYFLFTFKGLLGVKVLWRAIHFDG